jgi:2-polyprenyl-3-methyl-5-hydroxy-6-metoxy-1,4-benzoquinol methylase
VNAAKEPHHLEAQPCPHCGHVALLRVFAGAARADRAAFELLRCKHCALVHYANPVQGFVPAMYDYYKSYGDSPREVVFNRNTTISQRLVLQSMGALVTGRRMLDVGCGAGQFVDTARSEGWDATGIDLSEAAIRVAKRLGVPCEREDFFAASLDDKRFDLILMSEFIEHVSDAGRFFARAEQLLAPGGVVYLTTPNFDSISRHVLREELTWIHPEHVLYFDPRSIARVVRDSCSLEVLRIETKNLAVADVISTLMRTRLAPLTGSLSALKRAVARPRAGAPSASSGASAAAPSGVTARKADEALRTFVRQSPIGATALASANLVLRALGVGDSLVAVLRKR